eukprot:977935_1
MNFIDYLLSDDFIAGSLAGSIGIVATQPFDTIRIRCQLNKTMNMQQHAISIVKGEGLRGLFRGVASPTLSVGFMSAILFQAFETSRSLISTTKRHYYNLEYSPETTYGDLAIAGGIAGTISCFITSPTELFKILVQQNTSSESATMKQEFKEAYNIYKTYGFTRGWYRGLNVTMYRDAPAFAIYFPLYEIIINNFDPYRATKLVPFIGGGIAGMCSWAAVYPIDHIKTLYQLRQYKYHTLPLFKAIKYHIRTEGGSFRHMYKGLGATLLRCTPQHAVVFVCYEEVKKFKTKQREILEEEDIIRIQIPMVTTTAATQTTQSNNPKNTPPSPPPTPSQTRYIFTEEF